MLCSSQKHHSYKIKQNTVTVGLTLRHSAHFHFTPTLFVYSLTESELNEHNESDGSGASLMFSCHEIRLISSIHSASTKNMSHWLDDVLSHTQMPFSIFGPTQRKQTLFFFFVPL